MKVVSISMVKNEADIVEPFIRHNLDYVDRMYVFDHCSSDETPLHLASLRAEGLQVELIAPDEFLTSGAKLQGKITTQLLRQVASREAPAVVVLLDADEFLHHPAGKDGMLHDFARLPQPGIAEVPWVTHVIPACPAADYFADPPRSFRTVRRVERPPVFKVAVRSDDGELHGLRIADGNHAVLDANGKTLPAVRCSGLCLRHVPVRNEAQAFQKAVLGWLGTLRSNPDARRHGLSFHQQEIFDLICSNGAIGRDTLHRLSCGYAQDACSTDLVEVDTEAIFRYERRLRRESTAGLALVLRELERQAARPQSSVGRMLENVELYSIRFPLLRPVIRALAR